VAASTDNVIALAARVDGAKRASDSHSLAGGQRPSALCVPGNAGSRTHQTSHSSIQGLSGAASSPSRRVVRPYFGKADCPAIRMSGPPASGPLCRTAVNPRAIFPTPPTEGQRHPARPSVADLLCDIAASAPPTQVQRLTWGRPHRISVVSRSAAARSSCLGCRDCRSLRSSPE
jgi:hypothetical protein